MAAGGNEWKKTPKHGVYEYFLCGEHKRCDGWNLSDVVVSERYPYISDVDDRVGSAERESFPINSLIHVTTPQAAVSILQDGGFKPKKKPLPDNYPAGMDNNFIWFGLSVEEEELTTENAHIHNSPPFCYESRYGNIMFKYDINDVIQAYSEQFCKNDEPKFLVMGTFAYKQEIMHTILVCPPSMAEAAAKQLPDANNATSVIFQENRSWFWEPDSTGVTYNSGFRRWEHAAFAFLIPDESDSWLKLKELTDHMSYCPPADAPVFRMHTDDNDDKHPYSFDEILTHFENETSITKAGLLNIIKTHLKKQVCKEHKKINKEYTEFVKVNLRKLQSLLQVEPLVEIDGSFSVHELEEKAKGSETWMTWFRENIHPSQ